jgi:hypothetical protein
MASVIPSLLRDQDPGEANQYRSRSETQPVGLEIIMFFLEDILKHGCAKRKHFDAVGFNAGPCLAVPSHA